MCAGGFCSLFCSFIFFAHFVIDNQCLCEKKMLFFARFLRKNCALFAHVCNVEWVMLCAEDPSLKGDMGYKVRAGKRKRAG